MINFIDSKKKISTRKSCPQAFSGENTENISISVSKIISDIEKPGMKNS